MTCQHDERIGVNIDLFGSHSIGLALASKYKTAGSLLRKYSRHQGIQVNGLLFYCDKPIERKVSEIIFN